jgi:hypothetical protein
MTKNRDSWDRLYDHLRAFGDNYFFFLGLHDLNGYISLTYQKIADIGYPQSL